MTKTEIKPDIFFRYGCLTGVTKAPLGDGWWQCELEHSASRVWIPVHEDFIRRQLKVIPIIFRRAQR